MIYIKIQAYSVKSYTSFFYAKIRRLEKYVFQKRASQTGISGRNEKDESQGSGNVERGIFAVGKALLMAASKASVCLWGNKKDILNKVSSLYQVDVFMEYREAETVKDRVTEQHLTGKNGKECSGKINGTT